MATLSTLREKQKYVLWAFLVAFLLSMTIGGLVGGANLVDQIFGSGLAPNSVGSVNGQQITLEELSQEISRSTEEARQQYGTLNDNLLNRLSEQAWDNVVTRRLLLDQLEDRTLQATPAEIYYRLQNYPPEFIKASPAFQKDGQFNITAYQQALNNPVGQEWLQVEMLLAGMLPNEKLSYLVRSMVNVSENEVHNQWVENNTKVTVDYIYVPFSKIKWAEIPVSDAEIGTYYREHKDKYVIEATRSIDYVFWERKPSAQDSLDVYNLGLDLARRSLAGEDFGELALQYSEDPGSGPSGGDLGWFGQGQMVPVFDEAAFAAKPGDVVGPVLSNFGYHIINVVDKRDGADGEEVLANHILLKIALSPRTTNALRDSANIFSFDAADSTFDVALKMHNLQATMSAPLNPSEKYLGGKIGMFRAAVKFAHSSDVGTVSEVMSNETGYLVARLSSATKAGYKNLADATTTIRRALQAEAARADAAILATEINTAINSGISWATAIDSIPEAQYQANVATKMNGTFRGIGTSSMLTGLLKTMQAGEVSGVVRLEWGYVIMKLTATNAPDEDQFAIDRDSIYKKLYETRLSTVWTNWLADLKSNSEIIDNRHAFY